MDHIAPWSANENGDDMVLDAPKHDEGEGSEEDGANAMSTDSSEEEEDDPEEARKIREGFIVDEDEEDEEEEEEEENEDDRRAEKRRRRKERHRTRDKDEDEEEDGGIGELDEDDLDIVEQYTGQRVERHSKSRLKRLRRARDEDDEDDDVVYDRSAGLESGTTTGRDLGDLWDDEGALRIQHRDGEDPEEPEDDDDMRGFIEADEDEEVNDMGEAEKQERLERRRAEKERRKNAGDISRLAGLDQNALAILYEVFGDGNDYDEFLGDDVEEVQEIGKESKYNDVFEPSEIRSRMLTEDDDLIRNLDMPERMLLATSSLSPDTTLSLDPQLSPSDLSDAAYWVSLRLGQRIERDFFREDGQFRKYLEALIAAVRATLDFLFIQSFEVPFIWTHKRDFIWHVDGAARIELLSVAELWRVYNLGQKFRAFQERKRILEATHAKLSTPDDYYKIDIQPKIDSMEAISDATEWLSLQHRLELQDATMIEDDGKTKRPTRISTFEMLKKSPIDRLVKDFCPPAREIARKVRQVMNSRGQVIHMFLDDPALPPLEHVAPYVDAEKHRLMEIEHKRWATNPGTQDEPSPSKEVNSQEMLDRARLLIAIELGKDPLLRHVVRDLFKASAQFSCLPTERGLVKIDETHPYFNFKYLDKKPVSAMTRGAQFLHIMAAEAEHLITLDVTIGEDVRAQFLNDLIQAVSSDGYGTVSKLWNEVRAQAVTEAVDKIFLPFGAKWIREWLREEVEDWLARRCGDELERRVNVKPLFTSYSDPGLGAPRVMAISWGDGDPKKDAISVVFLDEAGRLREHTQFDNLKEHNLEEDFKNMVRRWKPDLIVIGGFSASTHRLSEVVKQLVLDPIWQAAQKTPVEGSFDKVRPTEVRYVLDAVARIFQHSKRASEEFGTLSTITRYCIGLARYAQSPLNEYAALGPDITAITFDQEAQHLVPREKLLIALERSLVNVVNRVGVDINRAVHDPYYQTLLPFVSGLGPRKAQHIARKVSALGNLVNREQFVRDGIMTTKVWLNSAAFLRIPQDTNSKSYKLSKQSSERADFSEMPDPLDGTRLHPQDYDLARKMAVDALGHDEEDYADEHPSAVVVKFLEQDSTAENDEDEDSPSKKHKKTEKTRETKSQKTYALKKAQLEALSLDDFALNLLESQKEQKRMTLDMISDELLDPFKDNRPDFTLSDEWEILTMLTGESEKSLRLGLILSVQVLRIKQNFVIVKLASNLEGIINTAYLGEEGESIQADRVVKVGQPLQARLIEFKPAEFYIELSARYSDLRTGDESFRRVDVDEYYNNDRATRDKDIIQRKKNNQKNRSRRMVKHPNFFNMNSKQAEEHLSKQHRGDVVIRPSSKGPEHLAVTWKVDRGIYQHIDVLEVPVNINDPTAGFKYIVDPGHEGQREFSDLDELIVIHVKAMARKVEELMAHDKYKHESPVQLANTLTMLVNASPDKSLYAFGLNPDRPGYFNLMFKANTHSPVVTWPVKVTPEAYVFFGEKLPSVPQLCDAFKMRHIGPLASAARPLQGGMTPFGARTPGRATPAASRLQPQSKTPNPYQTPQQPAMMTPVQYPPPPMTTGPQLVGYGMPPPQTPQWPGMSTTSQPPQNSGMSHMNPARAAMIQQSSGWGNAGNGGGRGNWPRR
ncbi:Transcription elongation factor spt6 [Serendipita sp. 396]|nr:Transcription elongation factor spt6 [Serendipita sp. 396]